MNYQEWEAEVPETLRPMHSGKWPYIVTRCSYVIWDGMM